MSFAVQCHYLIEPKPELVVRLEAMLDSTFSALLLQRQVVSKTHVPSLDPELEQANITSVKKGFLAKLQFDTVWDSPDQFGQLFGSTFISPDLFDQWWRCTKVEFAFFEDWQPYLQQL
jgi:hypothetical protein